MSYYNTTRETGSELRNNIQTAKTQDEKIKAIISGFNGPFSFKDIYRHYSIEHTPITSVRRSINTLKNERFIRDTGEMVMGIFSRKETQYIRNI